MGGRAAAALGAIALLGALVSSPAPVRADEAAMSRFHYDQATRDYEARRYEAAVQQFFLAQRLSPNPRTVFNIALCFVRLRRHADAFHFLSEYLSGEDDAEGAGDRRRFAEEALADLSARVARVGVVSDPPGARIFVDHREHGAWGTTPQVLALAPGEHRVWVEREGYRTAETTVQVALGTEVEALLTLSRIVGALQVRGQPGASARLTDREGVVAARGVLPFVAEVPPGRYDLEVTAEGFRASRRFVTVAADAAGEVLVELEALPPPTGTLRVTANVVDAVVELDGEPVGLTPLAVPDLGVSDHEVRVTAPSRLPWVGRVGVRENGQTWLRVDLVDEPHGRSRWTWGLGGLGVGMLGAGGVTGAYALRQRERFQARYGEVDAGDLRRERARGQALAGASDLLFGTGLVALVASVVLFFVTDDSEVRESSAEVSGAAP